MSQPDTPSATDAAERDGARWWRSAAIYQVYPRSFADGNGDGIGDLAGIRARLGYLRDLGIDAIWFSPWFPSPMADAGYDVSDYRDIDPAFGTLADAEQLIAEAHVLGIRTIIDIVPNHCSNAHPWFVEALAAGPGSAVRDLFWFRPGRGEQGELAPNNWQSIFGGPAWTRTTNPDGTPGEWYLHLFAPEQPDLNWENPKVREEFEDILRFWFRRGVDGVRIDSVAVVMKEPTLADYDHTNPPYPHPYEDRDEVHPIYQGWRVVADSYEEQRALIGEIWLPDTERFALYLRPNEIHTAFNFDFLASTWDAAQFRRTIDATLAAHAPVGAPATWVLSNHDVTRHVTRYGREDTTFTHDPAHRQRQHRSFSDLALGTRRARAATLLSMALPGSVYIYQGEELGLWEVEDIPDEARQDPMFARSGGTNPGRDGCRVPLPWRGSEPPFGFSPPEARAEPWLPQPAGWRDLTAEVQSGDPSSMLELYRSALRIRRSEPGLGDGPITWLGSPGSEPLEARTAGPAGAPSPLGPENVLAFARGERFACVVNLSAEAIVIPEHREVLLASGPLEGGLLPTDTTVWLRTG